MKFDRKKFFDAFRDWQKKTKNMPLTQTQTEGLERLLTYAEKIPILTELDQLAYALATSYHETAFTFQPIKEKGGRAYFVKRYWSNKKKARELGNRSADDAVAYSGKGDVQLTGRTNYSRATRILRSQFPEVVSGIEECTGRPFSLVVYPDLALDPLVSYLILMVGLRDGWFTGKKIGDYDRGKGLAYEILKEARKTVNGTDQMCNISSYAEAIHGMLIGALAGPEDAGGPAVASPKTEVKQPTDNPPEDPQDESASQSAGSESAESQQSSAVERFEQVTSQVDRPLEVAHNTVKRTDSIKSLATTVIYWITSLGTLIGSLAKEIKGWQVLIVLVVLAGITVVAYKYLQRQEEMGKIREAKR